MYYFMLLSLSDFKLDAVMTAAATAKDQYEDEAYRYGS